MIYLLRHGLDDENYIGGWSDVDLVSEGRKQIENSRDFIEKNNLNIEKIITSDVKRALTTTKIINEKLKLAVIKSSKLRELDKGTFTGLEKSKLSDSDKEFMKNIDIKTRYPSGEAMIDLYNRIELLLSNLKEDNVLLVTHRGVINMIYYILTDTPLDMDKEKFNVTHGSIHELDTNKRLIRRIY